ATWNATTRLISAGQHYTDYLITGPLANPGGKDVFDRESWGYTATQLDLASLAGQSIRFRFRAGTETSLGGDYGWFVDDVRLYTCGTVGGIIEQAHRNYAVSEAGPSVTVTVKRSGTAGGVTVDYATADGTAHAGEDYVSVSGTLTFAEGVTSQP